MTVRSDEGNYRIAALDTRERTSFKEYFKTAEEAKNRFIEFYHMGLDWIMLFKKVDNTSYEGLYCYDRNDFLPKIEADLEKVIKKQKG